MAQSPSSSASSLPSNNCSVIGRKPLQEYVGDIKRNCETKEEYAAFLAIPYAKCPRGLKQFQAPESLPTEPISDPDKIPTYKASTTDKCSVQFFNGQIVGSSDCLYLNIFLPKRPELIDDLLPVLVYIHGGGFECGNNDPKTYSPDTIIQHGLIFVTINYRLGLHGFLNLHMKEYPGNVGLKDQVKALEWIRDNIECFKGDSKNVTISGCSAGGTCVNLHLISPASKDLFHKAIVQSGGIFSPWGYRGHQRELKKVLLTDWIFARSLYDGDDMEGLYLRAYNKLNEDRAKRHQLSFSPFFGPTVESIREGAFIPDNIEEMMENVEHNKPVMAGITKGEGIFLFIVNEHKNFGEFAQNDEKFEKLLMDTFRWSSETARKCAPKIKEKYLPDISNLSTEEKDRHFALLVGDICFRRFYDYFKFGPEKTVHKNLYVYRFDHFSEISLCSSENLNTFYDATHNDENRYLYCPKITRRHCRKYINEGPDQNKEIRQVMNHLCSLWANFCKTGVPKSDFAPDVEWRRHTEEEPCYLSISKDLVLKEESLFQERWSWLNALVEEQPVVESLPSSPE